MTEALSVKQELDGKQFILFGGTGFLGKVWLCLMLDRFPNIEHVYMVVRARKNKDGSIRQSSESRFVSEVLTSPVFDPLRETYPGTKFEAFVRSKITPINGDVTHEFGGISSEIRKKLRGKLHALVNSAGVVEFNPPLDKSLNVNAFGMKNLVSLAKDLGDVPFMHTSTCYVAGDMTGQVDEIDPRTYPFPKADELNPKHWDPEREIEECMEMVRHAHRRAKDAFRQSDFLDQARQNLKKNGEPGRGSALQNELEKVERKFIEGLLIDEGTERAQFWGWHNIYTYTKSIGEQILCSSGLRFTIVRPAVIESSMDYPKAGWNEGINTSAPLIYLINQGPLGVPATDESVLDIIPVDQVAIGMILSLAELLQNTHKVVYQYGSSDSSPLKMNRLIELVSLNKRQRLRKESKNPLAGFINQRIEGVPITVSQYRSKGPALRAKQFRWASQILSPLENGALSSIARPAVKGLNDLAKGLDIVSKITDQFVPFTATHNYRFSTLSTKSAFLRLSDEEKVLLPWAPESIDWHHYLLTVHCPGLVENVFPLIEEKKSKSKKPLRTHDHLVDLIDDMAERFEHVPALMRTHEDGFSRLSYRELQQGAHTIALKLQKSGLKVGDRVMLSGQNHPCWPVAYFGILFAGGVAVPMDVEFTPAQALNVELSSEAKIGIFDSKATSNFAHVLESTNFDLESICQPVENAKSQLEPVEITGDSLASILYTSGTTGSPKGVMLTHGNFTAMLGSLGKIFPLTSEDRILSVLPLHHTFEFSCGLLLPLSLGAQIIYLDEITGERLSHGLKAGQVTGMIGVPALWQLLERRIQSQVKEQGELFEAIVDSAMALNRQLGKSAKLDLGRLLFAPIHGRLGGNIRFLVSGGAALPTETQQFYNGLGLFLTEGYGLTEAAPVLTVANGAPGAKVGTVGKSIPGITVKIKDPDEKGIGEVLAKGPNVMQGYFNNEDATNAAFDNDGWLKTGDMGKLDSKGRLVLVGRAKEVVVTAAGENIYLDDVETTIGSIRFIKEYVLVGLTDPRGGERLGMLAVIDDESTLDRSQLETNARDAIKKAISELPSFQRPAVWHIVDADLPRTRTRKIQRGESKIILERIIAATPQSSKKSDISSSIAEAIASVTGTVVTEIHTGSHIRDDLGLDSLMAVELSSALAALGKGRPDPDDISKCETVSDLIRLVGDKPMLVDVEDEVRESRQFPEWLAQPLKSALGTAQQNFYSRALQTEVIGQENIPTNRQLIVVSNHCSHLDMGLVKHALGSYGKKMVALAAKDYFFEGNPWVVAYFDQMTNLQPIDRKRGYRASLTQAIDIVDNGHVVLLFPEGTRRQDGSIGDFKPLVGDLSLRTNVDILPMYLDGTFEALPKGAIVPRGRTVKVHVGPPLSLRHLRPALSELRSSQAARVLSGLAKQSVIAMKEGETLDVTKCDLQKIISQVLLDQSSSGNPLQDAFNSLPSRFDGALFKKPIAWYFTLDGKEGPRFTVSVSADRAVVTPGKPPSGNADCVVKTAGDVIRRIIQEGYTPAPAEFFSGNIKTNNPNLLMEFQRIFNLKGAEA
ncbi:MAG: AMP-binding protein [Myxococcota bacterium]